MVLSELKLRISRSFGPGMEHATPANVREFLDEIAYDIWQEEQAMRLTGLDNGQGMNRIELSSETPRSYEDILRHFFADILNAPNEQALIQLWLLALDLAYAGLEEQAGHNLSALFAEHPLD